MRFLILEDSERICRIYQKFFDTKNYHVDFVKNAHMCLEKFTNLENYDYVILEKPSKIDEFQLEDKISEINPAQKILFLSPYMNLGHEVSIETQYLVEKPFAMVTVLGKIQLEQIKPVIKVK